jgi:hypothetical protein
MRRATKPPQRSFPCLIWVILVFAVLQAAAAQTASDTQAIFIQAKEALKAGEYKQTEAGWQKVFCADPHSAAAHSNLWSDSMRTLEWGNLTVEVFMRSCIGLDLHLRTATVSSWLDGQEISLRMLEITKNLQASCRGGG